MRFFLKTPSRLALMAATLAILTAAAATAQPRQRMPDPEQRLERMMSHLTGELDLSDEQAARVRTILGEQIQKQQEMFEARREESQQARETMREDMEKWRQETDGRMSEVLTEEQTEKYQEYMQKNRRRGPRGERGARMGRRGRRG